MVNIIIPVYNGLELLRTPLDSLVRQVDKEFMVTVVQDCDGLDYLGIIGEYRDKGLHIQHVKSLCRIRQGMARQLGIESCTNCDYVMFLDQDDELMPNAVQILQGKMDYTKSDMVISKYIKESADDAIVVGQGSSDILTQHHGKIYSLDFLNRNNIEFSANIEYAEDSTFNCKAYYCSNKTTYTDAITYRWIYNEKSASHDIELNYYPEMLGDFITGQVEAILHVFQHNENATNDFLVTSLLSFYELSMIIRSKGFSERGSSRMLKLLGKNERVKKLFEDKSVIVYLAKTVRGGTVHSGEPIFFNYSFMDWVNEWIER